MNNELSAIESTSLPGKRNLRAGWWTLLVFVCLGVLLEIGLGFRGHFYMDVSQQTRRLMWRLSHAHGTLLAMLNILYGLIAAHWHSAAGQQFGSRALLAAGWLIPSGFFLAGLFAYQSTPGLATLLIPPGAILLAIGIFLATRNTRA